MLPYSYTVPILSAGDVLVPRPTLFISSVELTLEINRVGLGTRTAGDGTPLCGCIYRYPGSLLGTRIKMGRKKKNMDRCRGRTWVILYSSTVHVCYFSTSTTTATYTNSECHVVETDINTKSLPTVEVYRAILVLCLSL